MLSIKKNIRNSIYTFFFVPTSHVTLALMFPTVGGSGGQEMH